MEKNCRKCIWYVKPDTKNAFQSGCVFIAEQEKFAETFAQNCADYNARKIWIA